MKNRGRIILSVTGVALSLALLVIGIFLVENEIINSTYGMALIIASEILLFVAIFYAARVEYETGIYECRKCGHTFVPTFKAYLLGAHTLTTRHLKCPKCEEKSWCKKSTKPF